MSELTRREFLKFLGATGAIAAMGPLAALREAHASGLWFTPVRIPSPLPIYTTERELARDRRERGRRQRCLRARRPSSRPTKSSTT